MKVVCVADCGVDRFLDRGLDLAGGIGLNVAAHCRRLLGPEDSVTVIAPVGTDAAADLVRAAASDLEVDARLRVVPGATPVQPIRDGENGERVFDRYQEGVLASFRLDDDERRLVAASDVLFTTAFGQALPMFGSVSEARSDGLRAVDYTNANDIGEPVGFVARHAALFDIGFFGLHRGDGDLIDRLEAVARSARRLFVVTLGPAGSIALGGEQRIVCAAEPVVRVVDTTGAGDAFAAGFLCAYARHGNVAASLQSGSRRSATAIQVVGGTPV